MRLPKFSAAILVLSTVLANSAVGAAPADPPVPPGRDPGGIAVAITGPGLDYTQANVAQRLARDGEGEITGYDFADDDRRPYCTCPGTAIADAVIGEGQAAKVIAVRSDMSDTTNTGRAIRYAAATPAKIMLLPGPVTTPQSAGLISAAAARFPKLIFIAAVGDAADAGLAARQPNLIFVAAAGQSTGQAPPGLADLMVPIDDLATQVDRGQAGVAASLAAARVAALAARLQAVEPDLAPDLVKDLIMKLAEPAAGGTGGARTLLQPRRHFWLE